MSYDLFLGCVIPARLPFLELSSRKIFEKLGIELNDVDGFSCCPDPTGIELIDQKTWLAMGARNLSLCNKNGGVVSFCSGCVETLKGVNYHIKKEESVKKDVNEILSKVGKIYDGSVDVKHFAQVLYENIEKVRKNVVKPLENFKIAVHYGCHYLRPSEIIAWDDPFEPRTLDEIVEVLGAESIDYDMKAECCGNPVDKSDKELSLLMIKNKLEAIQNSGANCIALVCPACYQQFEFNQKELNKSGECNFEIPVFYLSELIALAFGFKPEELGFNFHRVKPKVLFEKIQFFG
ncbi:MAG: CoB--CoM heterodisulfide reductase iron-sulfur subunit B family protein [Candidatus Lokiarchaeota archaeon]|nr:CoB--CoM heterodisulfide reductase iron-sulfur subunit B family protein [Candidatus Lokiarchaeota archaeon]